MGEREREISKRQTMIENNRKRDEIGKERERESKRKESMTNLKEISYSPTACRMRPMFESMSATSGWFSPHTSRAK